jgi:thiamine pyrophosphokinase
MKEKIVQTVLGITIIGAGSARSKQISKSRKLAPYVLAADGGARKALKLGIPPDAIIGDLDGLGDLASRLLPDCIHQVSEQDSTDFEKCLYSIDAPFVIAHGVTGTRFDHSLAAMNALTKYTEFPVIVVSGKDLIFLCPKNLHLKLPIETRLSLFPMGNVKGAAKGLEYALDDIAFSPSGRIGTSNRTVAKDIHLSFDTPRMLVLLSWKFLPRVVKALTKT